MNIQGFQFKAFAVAVTAAILVAGGAAMADPPSRVARLGYATGPVSFSPAGENDWFDATINRPLTSGDRFWTDERARAEFQSGGAVIRMDAVTGVSILNLDDRITQLQLTQGALNIRVRRLDPGEVLEVDTPNLAFTLRQPGEFRIEVDPYGTATTIVVRRGQGEAYGEDASYVIDSRQPYRFLGTGLREYEYVDVPGFDDFDRWSSDRDRRYDDSNSARYVSQDVVGYQDLDDNGTWRVNVTFGNVWVPNRVPVGWAPYRYGHWAWIDPWGWTWVDDAPWGFAVSHYGRWTNFDGTWGWVPGPARSRAYYAPALVVFLGGNNASLRISSGNVGGVAWFPLGPRDVYRPSYPVSRGYFENINRSNTVINNTVINNYYDNSNVTNVYVNRQVPGAVVAVPRTTFAQSLPVNVTAVRVAQDTIPSGPVEFAPPVVPTEKSVRGAATQRDRPPPSRVFERPVVARTAPPPATVGFAAQQPQLRVNPGKPLDDAARSQLQRGPAAPAPVVKVIAQAPEAPPTMLPPPPSRAPEQRGRSGQQGKGGQHGQPVEPTPKSVQGEAAPVQAAPPPQRPVEPQAAPQPQATAPAQAVPPAEQRGKSGQQGKGGQRGQPVEPEPKSAQDEATPVQAAPPPQRPVEPQASPQPQATAPAQAVPPPEQRGKSGQQGKGGQHGQPVVPTPAPLPGATVPSEAAPPQQGAPPASAAPESATPEPTPVTGKKKDKKKAVDEPTPEEGAPQAQ
jgi:hypothetical protein